MSIITPQLVFVVCCTISSVMLFLSIVECLYMCYRSKKDLTDQDKEIWRVSGLIRSCSWASFNAQTLFGFVFAPCILGVYFWNEKLSYGIATGYGIALLCAYYCLLISVYANARTAIGASYSVNRGFKIAYASGRTIATFLTGACFGLIAINSFGNRAFALGCCIGTVLAATFIKMSGGIFTKAADISADLVGKVFQNLPEDDPRNPAVIADNVGDNIGDSVGAIVMLLSTFTCAMFACMEFKLNPKIFIHALIPSTLGSLTSIILTRRIVNKASASNIDDYLNLIYKTMYRSLYLSVAFSFVFLFVIQFVEIIALWGNHRVLTHFGKDFLLAVMCGVFGSLCFGLVLSVTDQNTSVRSKIVQNMISATHKGGSAMNVITGYFYSMEAVFWNIGYLSIVIVLAYIIKPDVHYIAAIVLYLIGFIPVIMAMDSYGPISDNAGGIAEMSGCPKEVREKTDALDSVGNTTKALTKGYSIGIVSITYVLLAYIFGSHLVQKGILIYPMDIAFNVSLLFGAAVPFMISSNLIKSVYQVANKALSFISDKIDMEPGFKPKNYYTDVVTMITNTSAIRAGSSFILLACTFGLFILLNALGLEQVAHRYLCGLLSGISISSVCLAIKMTISGAAWDNVKKGSKECYAEIKTVQADLAQAKANLRDYFAHINTDINLNLDKLKDGSISVDDGGYNIKEASNNLLSKMLEDTADIDKMTDKLNDLRNMRSNFVIGDTIGDPLKDTAGPTVAMMPLFYLIGLALI